jgi:hypothetical protein
MFATLAVRATYVSLRWSEENLLAVARSINSPLMGRKTTMFYCAWKLKLPFDQVGSIRE